jgi:hypothetical protein
LDNLNIDLSWAVLLGPIYTKQLIPLTKIPMQESLWLYNLDNFEYATCTGLIKVYNPIVSIVGLFTKRKFGSIKVTESNTVNAVYALNEKILFPSKPIQFYLEV